ncbi:MAG: undecaprenyldiphospho-muramoylpentapeptide beta-N-acetylglucosaminyltransferase [Patescibacteria group bacterium]
MKILFAGGGTMGSVSPLIAVYEKIKDKKAKAEFLFLGTKTGPEKEAVASYKIPYRAISSGKLRRYFDRANFSDIFKIFWGFIQSFFILLSFRPKAMMVAGSFVGVPVAWAARILFIPVLIHQQDIVAGLANKLMANAARKITVSFEPSLRDFSSRKTILTGNPVRQEFFSCEPKKDRQILGLKKDLPVVLIFGGGTGATKINETVEKSLAELLTFCQVIHLTGKGKNTSDQRDNYYQFEFLTDEMMSALCVADLVVSRAGMSTLSELAILGKPSIIIPIPGHQDANAMHFQKNGAAFMLSQEILNSDNLIARIKELIFDKTKREALSQNIVRVMKRDGADKVAKILIGMAK